MRKVLFLTVIALLSVGTLSAQSRALRDAGRAVQNSQWAEARTLIQQAAEHPDTANDPRTWKIKGDIGDGIFNYQLQNAIMGRSVNERAMFDGLMESFVPFVTADSLGQIPNARGRVRNPVRRDIAAAMRFNHPHFINGGIHFNEHGDFARAADFFQAHWDIPTLPMFDGTREPFVLDSTFQIIKYYAVVTALLAEQYPRAIAMMNRILDEPFIENNEFSERDIFELLVRTYQQLEDSVRFSETLQAGVARFPDDEFLVVEYIALLVANDQTQRAIEHIDRAVAANPALACDLLTAKGALLASDGNHEAAEAEYRRVLELSPHCERALEALARSYMVRAQEQRELSFGLPRAEQVANDELVVAGFQAALPLLETLDGLLQARSALQHEQNNVLLLLRNVYYNLTFLGVDKSAQLEAVEGRLPEDF